MLFHRFLLLRSEYSNHFAKPFNTFFEPDAIWHKICTRLEIAKLKGVSFLFTGHGRRPGALRARVRLVVPWCLHVRDALRGDPILRRVPGRNVREDHEPQRLLWLPSRYDHNGGIFFYKWKKWSVITMAFYGRTFLLLFLTLNGAPWSKTHGVQIRNTKTHLVCRTASIRRFWKPSRPKPPQNSRKTQGFDKAPRFEAQSLAYNNTFVL